MKNKNIAPKPFKREELLYAIKYHKRHLKHSKSMAKYHKHSLAMFESMLKAL